jgi:hypothetical protein
MSRTAPAVIADRQEEVAKLLIKGKRTKEIYIVMHQKYGVSQVTVERDVAEAYKWIKQYITRNIDDVIAVHISRYENIYDTAMDMFDFKSAIAALRAVEDILKIRENQPLVNVNHNTINIDGLSTAEIKEILSVGHQDNK